MHRILCLLIFTGTTTLLAQPDFTRADLFEIGDMSQHLAVDGTNIDPGPAGNGVTWDFSDLVRTPADDYEVNWQAVSTAPNAGQFPAANLVEVQDAGPVDAYTFYDVTDTRFTLLGLDLPDIGVLIYTDTVIWLDFPLTFNQTQMDDFIGTYTATVNGVTGTVNRTGDLTTKYDGYGTLILPNGKTVENVRRLKIDQTVDDVISAAGVSVTTRVVTETYNFMVEGNPAPVFHITIGHTSIIPFGIEETSVIASYQDTDGGGPGPVAKRKRGAHLTAQGGDFDTELLIKNPNGGDSTLTLQPYTGEGDPLSPIEMLLGAGSTTRFLQQIYFPTDAASFSVDGCDDCIFSVGYRAANLDDASTAHVHQTDRFETSFTVYPGEWDQLFDGAAIVNAGDGPARIEAIQVDSDGNQIGDAVVLAEALAVDAKTLTIFNNLFPDNPDAVVRLISDQEMAVMILRISNDGRFLYQNLPIPAPPEDGSERWLAHITSETGGFDTDIMFHNTGDSRQDVTVQPYAIDGTALAAQTVTLPAGATRRFLKTELLTGDASHASVTGAATSLVTVGYRARVENASTAAVHETTPIADSFSVYPGEWNVLYDGVALVNTGDGPAEITVEQVDEMGSVVDSVVLEAALAPKAKLLTVLEGTLAERPGTYLRFTTTQPLAVLSLRLSKDARYLYNNPPIPD